jgi:hypothetical protein
LFVFTEPATTAASSIGESLATLFAEVAPPTAATQTLTHSFYLLILIFRFNFKLINTLTFNIKAIF